MEKNVSLKWPLVVTAVVVVLRVVLERAGVQYPLPNVLGVYLLTLFIVPGYCALRIAQSGTARPYLKQIKMTALFATLARLMVVPTYWLAYIYKWPESRFDQLLGPDVTPLQGYLFVPFGTAAVWVVGSVVIGGGLGAAIIAVKRRGR